MWIQITDRQMINVDAKVVRIERQDTPLKEGDTGYYIGFFESLDVRSIATQDLQFISSAERDTAFGVIRTALAAVIIERTPK